MVPYTDFLQEMYKKLLDSCLTDYLLYLILLIALPFKPYFARQLIQANHNAGPHYLRL